MTSGKKQAGARDGTAGVGEQASRERFDNVGKIPAAAGAGSNRPRLPRRGLRAKAGRGGGMGA
jgi:hypothetical protein